MVVFLQTYYLSVSPATQKSDALITYKLINTGTGKIAIDTHETTGDLRQTGEELTLHKALTLTNVPNGEYSLCVTVNDRMANRNSESMARVRIE